TREPPVHRRLRGGVRPPRRRRQPDWERTQRPDATGVRRLHPGRRRARVHGAAAGDGSAPRRRLAPGGAGHGGARPARGGRRGAVAICAAPCVGPFLGGAFAAASDSDTVLRGSAWLLAYSAGLGVAFLLVAVFFVRGMTFFRWLRDNYRVFSVVGGVILVGLGLLLFFDEFYRVQIYTHRVLEALGLAAIYRSPQLDE